MPTFKVCLGNFQLQKYVFVFFLISVHFIPQTYSQFSSNWCTTLLLGDCFCTVSAK